MTVRLGFAIAISGPGNSGGGRGVWQWAMRNSKKAIGKMRRMCRKERDGQFCLLVITWEVCSNYVQRYIAFLDNGCISFSEIYVETVNVYQSGIVLQKEFVEGQRVSEILQLLYASVKSSSGDICATKNSEIIIDFKVKVAKKYHR